MGLWEMQDGNPGPAVSLVGDEASEHALKSLGRVPRILHIATHAFFLGDACAGRVEELNPRYSDVANLEFIAAQNPLLMSGLALAGANQRGKRTMAEEDGILTAEEISAMDLGGLEWAVLSACGTGLGDIRTGEGVLGLCRAFALTGARTVILSLWEVGDEVTRQWMAELYGARLTQSLDTPGSLGAATRLILEQRRSAGSSTHPYYWGAFVACGDWR